MEDASGDDARSNRSTRTRRAEEVARSAALERLPAIRDAHDRTAALERLRAIHDAGARAAGHERLRAARDGSARAAALELFRGSRDAHDLITKITALAFGRLHAIRDGRARGISVVHAPIYDPVADKNNAVLVARRRKEASEFIIDDDGRRAYPGHRGGPLPSSASAPSKMVGPGLPMPSSRPGEGCC
ncbi:unnamed protein product [Urochloa humidicola]